MLPKAKGLLLPDGVTHKDGLRLLKATTLGLSGIAAAVSGLGNNNGPVGLFLAPPLFSLNAEAATSMYGGCWSLELPLLSWLMDEANLRALALML